MTKSVKSALTWGLGIGLLAVFAAPALALLGGDGTDIASIPTGALVLYLVGISVMLVGLPGLKTNKHDRLAPRRPLHRSAKRDPH